MCMTLSQAWVFHVDQPTRKPVCSGNVVEDFWNVHFSCVTTECWVIGPDVDDFSVNLFTVLMY